MFRNSARSADHKHAFSFSQVTERSGQYKVNINEKPG